MGLIMLGLITCTVVWSCVFGVIIWEQCLKPAKAVEPLEASAAAQAAESYDVLGPEDVTMNDVESHASSSAFERN
eukprot:3269512-Prymnesium_polylepis.2